MTSRQEHFKQRRQHWQGHMEAWEKSGISQVAYCQEHNIKLNTFAYWRQRVRREASVVRLVEVPHPSRSPALIKLVVDGRYAIEVGEGFSPAILKQVVQVLRVL